ncbi:hypothetical protein LWF15_18530 [Kineosporia rhizophila]|uniref:hypothetical protein n=1 Tax=Kineosporia rhizophila TaxID=84633 RepID=UPI001E4F39FD|nr:hypothetical protein [Kineosporia rhizophila]MCE0537496.1 hypothetical protein [Kineosporia rhizophila]
MRTRTSLLSAAAVAAVLVGTVAAVSQPEEPAQPSTQPAAVQSPAPSKPASVTPVRKEKHGYKSMIVQGRGTGAPLDESMLRDLAERSGRSLDEVTATHYGSQEFGSLASDLEADPKSGYVQCAWHRSVSVYPWIRFTKKPDAAMLKRIGDESAVDVEVQWGAPLADKDLVRMSETIFGAVADYPGVANAVGGPESDGSIQVAYRVEKGATVDPGRLRKRALKAGAKVSPTGTVPVKVRLVESPGLETRLE